MLGEKSMPIVSVQKLEDADKDADSLNKFVNGAETESVKTRLNVEYPTLANAIHQIMETGGFEPFATETALLASVPTITKKAAKALDTKKVWLWDGSKWNDTGLSELDLAKKEIKISSEKAAIDFVSKYTSANDELLLAITDDEGNLTWLQVDKQTGLPTEAVIDVLRDINQTSVTDEQIYTENNERVAIALKDKNGNLTALTVREEDGMFIDAVIENIGERLNIVIPDQEPAQVPDDFRTYDVAPNINILKSISAGVVRHINNTALPASPYYFVDSLGQGARIYLPTNYDDSTPIPLVMVFDGVTSGTGGAPAPTIRAEYLELLDSGVALCKSQAQIVTVHQSVCKIT